MLFSVYESTVAGPNHYVRICPKDTVSRGAAQKQKLSASLDVYVKMIDRSNYSNIPVGIRSV